MIVFEGFELNDAKDNVDIVENASAKGGRANVIKEGEHKGAQMVQMVFMDYTSLTNPRRRTRTLWAVKAGNDYVFPKESLYSTILEKTPPTVVSVTTMPYPVEGKEQTKASMVILPGENHLDVLANAGFTVLADDGSGDVLRPAKKRRTAVSKTEAGVNDAAKGENAAPLAGENASPIVEKSEEEIKKELEAKEVLQP